MNLMESKQEDLMDVLSVNSVIDKSGQNCLRLLAEKIHYLMYLIFPTAI